MIVIIIGLHNGLPPIQYQAITWTNNDYSLIGPLGTNITEISMVDADCLVLQHQGISSHNADQHT